MDPNTQIEAMKGYLKDAYDAAEEIGATMPEQKNLENFPETLETIPGIASSRSIQAEPITAEEYNSLNLTTDEYNSKEITAENHNTAAKTILKKGE